jgi:hypothetical protein
MEGPRQARMAHLAILQMSLSHGKTICSDIFLRCAFGIVRIVIKSQEIMLGLGV